MEVRSKSPELAPSELLRYGRHLVLPEVGLEGQRRLKAASALVVGVGGLGSPVALYLAAAGVGRIGLVDFDAVDASNLQRQVLHGTAAIGRPKLDSARERLHDLNPEIAIETHAVRLDRTNALELLGRYDVVLDGTDNFATRYLVNDACVMLGKPNVFGSIFRFEGQATVFDAARGPCYRCLYPEPPPPGLVPSCAEGGVLGVLPGVIGTIQANEAIKVLLGIGTTLTGRLLVFDALAMKFRELRLKKDPDCPMCGTSPTIHELIDYDQFCGIPAAAPPARELSATQVAELLARDARVQLIDVRRDEEWRIAHLPGAVLVPLHTLPLRLAELDRSRPVVLYCHHGPRSAQALALLEQQGFANVSHLKGGIDAWSREVDPAVPRY